MRQVVLAALLTVSISLTAACDADVKCGEDQTSCGGLAGGTGGTGGSGGSGGSGGAGGTGGSGGSLVVTDCADHERTRALDEDPFALAGTVGTEPDLAPGFSSAMRLARFAEGLAVLEFTDGTQQVAVRWPKALTLFVVDEQVRVTRSRDWLELRSLENETVAILHVSSGNDLPGALEPTAEDGIVLRFVPQCDLGASDGCGELAVELQGTFGDDTFTVDSGAPGGPQGGYWSMHNWTLARHDCAGAGYASVIAAEGFLWNRAD